MLRKYLFLFALSISIYFLHAVITNQGLYGDGNGYYVYSQSLFFDHELNSPKVYEFLSNFQGKKYVFSRIFWESNRNPYSIGTSLIWIPGIFITSFFSPDRFDIVYELSSGITGILLMISGLYFLQRYLLNFFREKIVTWTILSTFFATSIFYYTAFEPALSHQPSFFIICFLLWWSYKLNPTKPNIFILGVISGVLAMTRAVDIILLIPVFWQVRKNIKHFWIVITGFLIAYSPQLINQYVLNGNVFDNPYLSGINGTWEFNFVHLFEYLVSPRRGLFLWSPILMIGMFGLFKSKSKIFLLSLFILWIITASWSAYLSAGFGQRMAFSTIPFFAYGIAFMFNKMSITKIFFIFIFFSFWNLMLLKNVYLHKDMFIQNDNFTISQFTKYMIRLN